VVTSEAGTGHQSQPSRTHLVKAELYSLQKTEGAPEFGEEGEVPRGTSPRDARDGYFGETVTCMNSPCAEMLLTRMVVPVAGSGTLAQPKLPMAGFGATQ